MSTPAEDRTNVFAVDGYTSTSAEKLFQSLFLQGASTIVISDRVRVVLFSQEPQPSFESSPALYASNSSHETQWRWVVKQRKRTKAYVLASHRQTEREIERVYLRNVHKAWTQIGDMAKSGQWNLHPFVRLSGAHTPRRKEIKWVHLQTPPHTLQNTHPQQITNRSGISYTHMAQGMDVCVYVSVHHIPKRLAVNILMYQPPLLWDGLILEPGHMDLLPFIWWWMISRDLRWSWKCWMGEISVIQAPRNTLKHVFMDPAPFFFFFLADFCNISRSDVIKLVKFGQSWGEADQLYSRCDLYKVDCPYTGAHKYRVVRWFGVYVCSAELTVSVVG